MPDFGRVFLMLKYTDITQKDLCPKLNGYGDNGQRKVWSSDGSTHCTCRCTTLSMSVLECGVILQQFSSCSKLLMYFLLGDKVLHVLGIHVMYSAWNPKDKYDMSASVFVVQFNGFMSLTS